MNLIATALSTAVAFAVLAPAQPIPSYKSQEDYCYHNPDMPTCIKGKPIDLKDLQPIYNPNSPAPARSTTVERTRPVRSVASPTPATVAPGPAINVPQARRKRGAPGDIRLGVLDWRLLHQEPDMLIGLNMSGLAESDLARTLIGQWAGKLGATEDEQKTLLAALSDIPQAVISIQRKEIIAVLTGHTDSFPERANIGGLQTVRVSADTIVLGTPGAVNWAVWRLNFNSAPTASIQEGQQLARTNDFWAWGKPRALAAFGQNVQNSPVSKFRLGVNFKDDFRLDMFLETPDAATAAKVLEASLKQAPKALKAGVEGSVIHYALIFDREAALQRFAGFMTDPMGKQFAPLLAAARQIAAQGTASPRPAPGKIVIDGLEDGPRIVQSAPRQ